MDAEEGLPYLHCPVCAFSLDENEQGIGICDNCGRVMSPDEVADMREIRARSEARGRRAIFRQRLAAWLGVILMVIGMALYFTHQRPLLLIARSGFVSGTLTALAIIVQRVLGGSLYIVLLPAGLIWLAMGWLAWASS